MNIGELIRLLGDGNYHSGQQLGERLGVSRTAVWKQLRKLEAMNLSLEAVKGKGYRLAFPLESLDGPAIVSLLAAEPRRHLKRLFVEDTLESTNTFLRERFRNGAGHAEVCLAERQTAGRGRRGKSWSASWGSSLILSLGWRLDAGVAALEGLSLAVGVVLAQVLEGQGAVVALKWPNDVLLQVGEEWSKVAGILLEVTGDVEGPCEVVVGVGLNITLNNAARAAIAQPVAALSDVVAKPSRNQIAADFVEALLNMLPEFERVGFGAWQEAWNRRHVHAGRLVRVYHAKEEYIAKALGVDASGNLRVVTQAGERTLAGGEISIRPED